ncbi:ATP-binding protein [Aequorivita sp. Q41]|uniref:sensor histidine kinase n=1 Tax=Aequorivita sp. Q41 TaxID=3153300 RepID=UPI003242164C
MVFFSHEITDEESIESMIHKEKHIYIFRMVQEALNNVLKHAKAKACKLEIYAETHCVLFKILDNGIGFDLKNNENKLNSLGMKTLKERAEIIEAKLTVTSIRGKGTTVCIKIPKI